MHPLYAQAAGMTRDVMAAIMEVPQDKGPGLREIDLPLALDLTEGILSEGISTRIYPGANQRLSPLSQP